LNYSVIGPGVSEDAKQNVKIAEAHGFNIGGVNAAPMNGSGLHSHTTAEVFLVYQGRWRFYWGVDGKDGEVFLNKGDVASFPTNMFRGFQNVGTDRGLLFVVLGENDPGVITWTPKTLSSAKDTGMVLLDDNTLVDTDLKKIPEDKKILDPLKRIADETEEDYQKLDEILKSVGVAYILQDNSVFPDMTVEENLLMGGYIKDKTEDSYQEAEKILEKYESLRNRRNQPAKVLSGGERRLLEISRALVMKPSVLLVDEPSIGLEPKYIDMVFEILGDLQHNEKKTIILVEQNAKKGLEFADIGYVLVSGQTAIAGKGNDLLNNPDVGRLFLGG